MRTKPVWAICVALMLATGATDTSLGDAWMRVPVTMTSSSSLPGAVDIVAVCDSAAVLAAAAAPVMARRTA